MPFDLASNSPPVEPERLDVLAGRDLHPMARGISLFLGLLLTLGLFLRSLLGRGPLRGGLFSCRFLKRRLKPGHVDHIAAPHDRLARRRSEIGEGLRDARLGRRRRRRWRRHGRRCRGTLECRRSRGAGRTVQRRLWARATCRGDGRELLRGGTRGSTHTLRLGNRELRFRLVRARAHRRAGRRQRRIGLLRNPLALGREGGDRRRVTTDLRLPPETAPGRRRPPAERGSDAACSADRAPS